MAHETLAERQVEYTTDQGRTWIYHSTYPTKEAACKAVRNLSAAEWPAKSFKRVAFKPAYKPDGTLA